MSSIEALDAPDKDRFVVHISREKNARIRVMSVELQHSDMRNRYSFKQGRSLSEVFVEPLAEALSFQNHAARSGDGRVAHLVDCHRERCRDDHAADARICWRNKVGLSL